MFSLRYFSQYSHWGPFWTAQLMFCIYGFPNINRAAQNDGFIGEYCGEYSLRRRHGRDVTFSFGYYYTVIFSLYCPLEESCNCRNKNNCPLDGKCLTPNIIYKAQIKSNQLNYKQKVYIGTAETDFKHRFNNHTKSFNLEHYENDTELSKEYWTIKRKHFTPKVTWRIIRKCAPFNTTKRK